MCGYWIRQVPTRWFSIQLKSIKLFSFIPNSACPNIVTKSQWNGRAAKSDNLPKRPATFVIVHHTVTGACSTRSSCSQIVRSIQNHHINQNKWSDIGYNFLISDNGEIYEGRGWNKWGAHAVNYNSKSIGVSFIGNFQNSRPTAKAINAFRQLVACAVERNSLSKNYILKGHRQVNKTACPGNSFYELVKTWPNYRK